MKLQNIIFVLFFIGFSVSLRAQISFSELERNMKTQKKYIVMNVSSCSCIYCMMQEKKINKDKNLKNKLNDDFYFLNFKNELQNCFTFNGQKYNSASVFVDKYGRDKNKNVAYPLWLIFDKNYNVVFRYSGLLSAKKIRKLLYATSLL